MMTVIIFLASLFSCIITYLATQDLFKNELSDGTPKNKVGRKEIVFIFCLLGLIILPVIQNTLQNAAETKKEKTLKDDYNSSLTANQITIKRSFDSGNSNLILILSKTIGEYKLKYDSVSNKITELIRDSSKTSIMEAETPVFELAIQPGKTGIVFTKKKYPHFSIRETYVSADAASTNFKVKRYLIVADSVFNDLHKVSEEVLFDPKLVLSKNMRVAIDADFSAVKPFSSLLLWLRGTYTNRGGNKILSPNNLLYYLDMNSNEIGLVQDSTKKRIIDFIKSHSKK